MVGMPRPKPLPPRAGIDAVRFRLPDPPARDAIETELIRAFPERAEEIRRGLAAGEVVDRHGNPVGEYARPVKGEDVWLHLAPPPEPEVPGTLEVVYRDGDMVVVDKPHFLATTPRAGHIRQTALVWARVATGEDELVPAHRLDRGTAGLVVMAVHPRVRGALAGQFQRRAVNKRYLAVTKLPEGAPRAFERRSRIFKQHGILQGAEVAGEPNAHTRGRLLSEAEGPEGRLGLWLLEPTTGQTHQLRIHLHALGMPIVGDDLYPCIRGVEHEDFSAPLQLLAAGLECSHPVGGQRMRFTSARRLSAWTGRWATEAEIWVGTVSGEI
ncbi:putative RNA pseudouridine synthase [Dietzia timorensis]|uniref:RNA pseudouridylate synthase n=2 Tax=Dietzia timorensis TaxID=499555 RepID=A0A173LPF2_9ACTN|nr:putative RNA pseudouridine synthase [Dietzia timorensis]